MVFVKQNYNRCQNKTKKKLILCLRKLSFLSFAKISFRNEIIFRNCYQRNFLICVFKNMLTSTILIKSIQFVENYARKKKETGRKFPVITVKIFANLLE